MNVTDGETTLCKNVLE